MIKGIQVFSCASGEKGVLLAEWIKAKVKRTEENQEKTE